MRPPRFVVFSINGCTGGRSFYVLDRAHNHREVASYRAHPNRDDAVTWAVAHAHCDRLNQQAGW
jgi:hypothetical protein